MNYIDLIFIVIFGLYVWQDYRRGFLQLTIELAGLILAFIIGLKYYGQFAVFLMNQCHLTPFVARPLSFVIIWFLIQIIFYFLARLILYPVPMQITSSIWNRYLGLIPAFIKGVIFVTMIVLLLVVSPINNNTRQTVKNSFIGDRLINLSIQLEHRLSKVFDKQETAVVTNNNQHDEITMLNFSSSDTIADIQAEEQMLQKTNDERIKMGLKPLIMDPTIQVVARAHSQDMFEHGYFSHNTLDNKTLFDRLVTGQIIFNTAAENIAFGPNIDLAHLGLMNSDTHRQNILSPDFSKVGIGIMKGDGYGVMITEDFAN